MPFSIQAIVLYSQKIVITIKIHEQINSERTKPDCQPDDVTKIITVVAIL